MNEDRLADIETKTAFQKNTIKDLSDTVFVRTQTEKSLNCRKSC
jgi:uncharacterized coiled-coil protein SlyX